MRMSFMAFVLLAGVLPNASGQPSASGSADVLFSRGAFEQAFPLYQEASRQDSKDVHALTRLGDLALYANRLNDAKRYFEAALALNAGDKVATMGLEEIKNRGNSEGTYQMDAGASATVPFVVTDPLPIVKVLLNDQREANFLIDTGAPGVVLDPATAKALHLDLESAGQGVFGGGQQAAVMRTMLETIKLNDVVVRHVPVIVLPMEGAPAPPGTHLDGIIGTSLFYHFLTTLDYVHGRLILAPRSDSAQFEQAAKERGDSVVPLWYVPDHFLFSRANVNGASALFNIDTGGDDVGVQVSKGFLSQTRIKLDQTHKGHMATPAGEITTIPFQAAVTIGHTTEKRVPGIYMPEGDQYGIFPFAVGGTLSHQFFRSQIVTFDFTAMQMVIAKSGM